MQIKSTHLSGLLVVLTLSYSQQAWAIKKCQDENGKWHYGDIAVTACKKSEVTTLNERGFIESKQDKAKTQTELAIEAQERAEAEEEARKERAAEEERIRILSVYETEEDIDRQRDNQLSTVQTSIAVHETYIKQLSLQNKRLEKKLPNQRARRLETTKENIASNNLKIEESKAELISLAKQKLDVTEKFEKEKELFRSLKSELSKTES